MAEVGAAGGILTLADLASYRPVLREPLALDVGGVRLLGVPPPSSGGAAIITALLYLSVLPTPLPTASAALAAHLQAPHGPSGSPPPPARPPHAPSHLA